ncbi:MAG: hypothetical protein IJ555_02005 [Ruminococcus sp.]|nr:hypothetical protein [Ruminococcus sp.]
MKNRILLLAAISAILLSGCGNIMPMQNTVTTTATTTTAESEAEEYATPEETQAREKLRKDTFIAEFWGQDISFDDTDALVKAATKDSSFEIADEKTSNQQKLAVKSKSGTGTVDVMSIDMSKAQLGYSLSYILTTFGDNYHSYTIDALDGVTAENMISENSTMNVVVSKGKYSRSCLIQKTDGKGSHYGYAETVVIVKENKLTLISGSFISADMMDRQGFASLLKKLADNVEY